MMSLILVQKLPRLGASNYSNHFVLVVSLVQLVVLPPKAVQLVFLVLHVKNEDLFLFVLFLDIFLGLIGFH